MQKQHRYTDRPDCAKRLFIEMWKNKEIYLLIVPAIVWYIVLCYFPMGGLSLAFKNYMGRIGIWGSEWIGFKNFEAVFASPLFFNAFWMTIYMNIVMLAICFPAPIVLALMLNELRLNKYKKALQTIFTFPNFLSWIIIASIIKNLLSTDGALNGFLAALNMNQVSILGEKQLFRPLIYLTRIWKSAGWSSIIYLATISGIDQSQYEAAEIDGANRWQRLRFITLPSLMGTVSIMFILEIGGMMSGHFDQIYNLQNDIVAQEAETLALYIYRITFERTPDYGFSTAVSMFCSVINAILMITANTVSRRLGGGGLIGDVNNGH
ncbi:MAG: sugar ABC transporter permease [Clostridia bacterium]|nr:sugar ABC transporter permease [Clostridia bacterium]